MPSALPPQLPKEREADFDALYRQYYPVLLSFFLGRGFSQDDAADLVQETFLRIYEGLPGLKYDVNRGWIIAIAINVYRGHLRRRGAHKRAAPVVSLEEVLQHASLAFEDRSSFSSPIDALLAKEIRTKLRSEIMKLPPQMRSCILLRVHGLKYREIAEVLHRNVDSIKSSLHQARAHLTAKLGQVIENVDF